MEIEQVAEMARAVAGLPQAERDYFDGMLADVRAKDADASRVAKLRALGDFQALDFILKDARRGPTIFDLDVLAVARGLVDAGFARLTGPLPNHARENRWEVGIRNIVHHLHGPRHEFEIYDIVDEVRELAEGRGRDAKVDLPEAITRIREVVTEIEGMARRGRPIENGPSLKHWLLRGLDALTGENHSGFATSLPQPKKKLVEEIAKDVPRPTWAIHTP
ncbi:hypothetical protein MKK69_09175 [Methylobacterium sp. J-026]|jgi:hypothetical protein|nr:hypothetical protein [Methylobacterium sp. J-026]MCJ2134223.1 hypothetical protein [Methylobacterium sp. J-026]